MFDWEWIIIQCVIDVWVIQIRWNRIIQIQQPLSTIQKIVKIRYNHISNLPLKKIVDFDSTNITFNNPPFAHQYDKISYYGCLSVTNIYMCWF